MTAVLNPAAVMASRDYQAWAETDQPAPGRKLPRIVTGGELFAALTQYQVEALERRMDSICGYVSHLRHEDHDPGERELTEAERLGMDAVWQEIHELGRDLLEAHTFMRGRLCETEGCARGMFHGGDHADADGQPLAVSRLHISDELIAAAEYRAEHGADDDQVGESR